MQSFLFILDKQFLHPIEYYICQAGQSVIWFSWEIISDEPLYNHNFRRGVGSDTGKACPWQLVEWIVVADNFIFILESNPTDIQRCTSMH